MKELLDLMQRAVQAIPWEFFVPFYCTVLALNSGFLKCARSYSQMNA